MNVSKITQHANQNIFSLSILITNIHTVTPNEILGKISKKLGGRKFGKKEVTLRIFLKIIRDCNTDRRR